MVIFCEYIIAGTKGVTKLPQGVIQDCNSGGFLIKMEI